VDISTHAVQYVPNPQFRTTVNDSPEHFRKFVGRQMSLPHGQTATSATSMPIGSAAND
jgi:hypothetical protein